MLAVSIQVVQLPVPRKYILLGSNATPYAQCSWLVFKIVDILRHHAVQHDAVVVTGIVTNILVIVSILSAFPWVRK